METMVTSILMLVLAAIACGVGGVNCNLFEKYITMDEDCYSSMWSAVFISLFE